MKDTLQFILAHLVEHPEEIEINELQQDGRLVLQIKSNTEDIGKIIGKNGRIIRAIRDIIKIIAAKESVYVDVTIAE